ncbi:MAG TPA: sulfatase [Planctomycetota bacterium]
MKKLLFALLLLGAGRETRPNILVLIADDWGYGHAGVYGDKVVRTPTFDQLASEGVLFQRAFCASPSCTPSRAALLTGQHIHRLRDSGNLWSTLSPKIDVYPDLLEKQGYTVGLRGKGWGPGDFKADGRARNPAGPNVKDFGDFLKGVPADNPFCFWFGSSDPHRAYEKGSGAKSGLKAEDVVVPPYFPDTPDVRNDILDYYFEVQRFDRDCADLLKTLEASGRAADTIVVVTSDNGMPFPRCKANVYDSGTRMPLAIRWTSKIKPRVVDALVSHTDLAPTFLEAAGLPVPPEMTGRSLLPLLKGEAQERSRVFFGRERHANVRQGDLSYPCRVIRTADFAYVRNLRPDRWPGGDPEQYFAVGPFGDCDNGPTKDVVLSDRACASFQGAFGKRPEEELFDLGKDPHQLKNLAADPTYAEVKAKLRAELDAWLKETGDPRALDPASDVFDKYPYHGKRG